MRRATRCEPLFRPGADVRVVSLLPSSTEMVHALGCGDRLVARSHECDHPPGVESLPYCSEPRLTPEVDSAAIEADVRALLREGLSIYRVDVDALESLRPDVILTQDQCAVCAVPLRDVEDAVCRLVGSRPEVVSLHPTRLADIHADVRKVARALGCPERADVLVRAMEARRAEIAERADSLVSQPRVAIVEWLDPIMSGGNWMPELIEAAGGVSCFGTPGEHSPWIAWGDLLAADPDALVVVPCGFGIDRTLAELASDPRPWADFRAVRAGRAWVADGHHHFNRPGPRIVESIEILAEVLHPHVFSFGHEGTGWRPFPR